MRLFYDTIKGGDFRSREDNVYRLAEISKNIIDQCVAQGVPFAREYGGLLDNRSFGVYRFQELFMQEDKQATATAWCIFSFKQADGKEKSGFLPKT